MDNGVNGTSTKTGKVTGAPKGSMNHLQHGFYFARRTLMAYGKRAIDGRSSTGKALASWRTDLITDLGGDVSTQQSAIIDLCVKSKLILDSIDAWLLTQPSLVLKRKRALMPVVIQRQSLADGLARYLAQLGLERRVKQKTLDEILSEEEKPHEP